MICMFPDQQLSQTIRYFQVRGTSGKERISDAVQAVGVFLNFFQCFLFILYLYFDMKVSCLKTM